MALTRVLVATGACLVLAGLPCLLALIVVLDIACERAWHAVGRLCRHARTGRGWLPAVRPRRAAEPVVAPRRIEDIAADLRRLGQARLGVATRSGVWYIAVQRAYDERLRLACQALDVPEYLDGLVGMDRELERLRVEAELRAAGLVLDCSGAGHPRGRQ